MSEVGQIGTTLPCFYRISVTGEPMIGSSKVGQLKDFSARTHLGDIGQTNESTSRPDSDALDRIWVLVDNVRELSRNIAGVSCCSFLVEAVYRAR